MIEDLKSKDRNQCCGCICGRCRNAHDTGPPHTPVCLEDASERVKEQQEDGAK